VRAKAAPQKAKPIIARSLTRLADRIERETATDPHGKEQAVHIRGVARTLKDGDGTTRTQTRGEAERIRGAVSEKEKATRYRELEEKLQQRDQARAKRRSRYRDDGGQER
jgi:hypothetical protein